MDDTISRRAAIHAVHEEFDECTVWDESGEYTADVVERILDDVPAAQPTLRERALMLLLNWAVECDFGYDSFPEEYERYKDEIEGMNYFDGMIYIAEKEVERNGRR